MITVIGDMVVDVIVHKSGAHYGTDTVSNITTSPGGQANNVAASIQACGGQSTLLAKVGSDVYGRYLIEKVQEQGISPAIERDQELETGKIVILVDKQNGERTMFTDRGANQTLACEEVWRQAETIRNSQCLYLSGYSFFDAKTVDAVMAAKEIAIKAGIPTAVDPSSSYFLHTHKQDLLHFIQGADYFFPNYEEGELLTGQSEPEVILTRLSAFAKHPVLKLGKEGCMVYHGGETQRIPVAPTNAIDTTGAGDAFIGAYLTELFRNGHNHKEAGVFANNFGAKITQFPGPQPF
ncbi:carbohydrate kinase family protein [Thalassobacillus sp. CUG 92003]|uniref:carbohydrate kinase family protein n=1 Tax=Thalassobacillus sp. CUG 92003 TaxID=2736641 RepID=UPI0015E6B54B|nr:carbohydrate kinase family protein [Thalassobacillus sp. CUG 92003]